MLTEKNSTHIRTMRHIRGFRSCRNATGVSMADPDRGRMRFEEEKLASRQGHRLWLIQEWRGRFEHGARRLRVLPPSGRF